MQSRSREVNVYNLIFVKTPVKFQSEWNRLNLNFGASSHGEIWPLSFFTRHTEEGVRILIDQWIGFHWTYNDIATFRLTFQRCNEKLISVLKNSVQVKHVTRLLVIHARLSWISLFLYQSMIYIYIYIYVCVCVFVHAYTYVWNIHIIYIYMHIYARPPDRVMLIGNHWNAF